MTTPQFFAADVRATLAALSPDEEPPRSLDDRIFIEALDSLRTPRALLGDFWDRVPATRQETITRRIRAACAAERALKARAQARGARR
jgi:hypothetical protein